MKVYVVQVEHGSYSDYRCSFLTQCHSTRETAEARVSTLEKADVAMRSNKALLPSVTARYRHAALTGALNADPAYIEWQNQRRSIVAGLLGAEEIWDLTHDWVETGHAFSVVELELVD